MTALSVPAVDDPEGAEAPETEQERARPQLRAVRPAPARMARVPFLLILVAIFGAGMAGLLMLNTTLQNQAFEARRLNRQVTELVYVQADLESAEDRLAAPDAVARRASALGMRANPYAAMIVLPGGKVLGDPTPVRGDEMSSMVMKSAQQLAAERESRLARDRAEKAAKAAKAKAKAEAKAAKEKAKAERAAAKQKAATQKAADQKAAKPKAGKPSDQPGNG